MRLIALLFAVGLVLGGCSEAWEPPAAAPPGGGAYDDACSRQAHALGFLVQGEGPARRDPYGNTVIPLLVTWGNSAVDIDCHVDPQGGITIE